MIVNTEESHEASYIGNIEENRVGIDKENINFLATLLTSNLYSKPLESFLRETVSNAYDSHVEAGTEEPILLLIEDNKESSYTYRISIRDYGTGISPERFEKIYRNIGSSTKRDSNDFIGMFGKNKNLDHCRTKIPEKIWKPKSKDMVIRGEGLSKVNQPQRIWSEKI